MRGWGALVLTACGRVGFDPVGGVVTYRDAVLADGPIAYWRLDDTDTVARDQTGNVDGSYVGTCTMGVAGALAGDANLAVSFDGSSCVIMLDDRLEFADNAPFTLETWVSEVPGQVLAHYITRESRSGNNPVDGYALLDYDAAGGAYMERVATETITYSPAVTIPRNQWVYLVGTYDGTVMQLYVDGDASLTPVADSHAIPTFATTAMLGRQPAGFFFAGVLDEIAIYDHALPPERIALHHRIGITGPEEK